MTLKDTFQQLVPKLFDKFTGIPSDITYRVVASDYALGGDVSNIFTDYLGVRAIQDDKLISNLGSGQGNRGVSQNIADTIDLVLLIPSLELPVTPNEGDLILFKSNWYTVSNVTSDPADAMWVISCGEGGL